MLYPNPYSQAYQQPYQGIPAPMDRLTQMQQQQYQMAQPTPQQQSGQSLLYVQGEAAAKSWIVGNGQSVLLMDSEQPVFYIKSADNSGIPLPLRIFDYKERVQTVPQAVPQAPQTQEVNLDKYVTRAEYDELNAKLSNELNAKYAEIVNKLNSFSAPDVYVENRATAVKSKSKGGNDNG